MIAVIDEFGAYVVIAPGLALAHARPGPDVLAEGLSNAGLAERLYISPRTAAVHVSNILSKLGMSSRTEVAAWATREGITGDA